MPGRRVGRPAEADRRDSHPERSPPMALTPSTMLPLGSKAPDFALPDPSDRRTYSLDEVMDDRRALMVAFLCNHCPYVKHVRHELAKLAREYQEKGVAVVGI